MSNGILYKLARYRYLNTANRLMNLEIEAIQRRQAHFDNSNQPERSPTPPTDAPKRHGQTPKGRWTIAKNQAQEPIWIFVTEEKAF